MAGPEREHPVVASPADPFLSIVTGTRNRPASIDRMVRSVLDHTHGSFEVLVGDASDEQERLSFDDPRVTVVPEPEPLGPPRGFNALLRRARGRWVCWLNDDLEVLPGFGDALRAAIDRDPEVDLFCLPVVERGDDEALLLLHMSVPYACMGAVRRTSGEALGWFDEGYSFYAMDPDFALRLILSGRRLAPAHGADVAHHRLDDDLRAANREAFERDNARMRRRFRRRQSRIRRCYRRSSHRYFRHLEVKRSRAHGCRALAVPEIPQDGASRPPPDRAYRLRAPGWWLGI
jgi:GT2 family glycosyltransferase